MHPLWRRSHAPFVPDQPWDFGVCSLDDSGQKIDTQFPLTTKSASRAPLSVQRNSRAQSGTGIPEPCCATWVAMSGSAHSSFENPLRG